MMPFSKQKNRPGFAGFLFLSLVLFIILSIACLMPIQPNDYWWYVRIGGDIAAQHSIPTLETLSYTQAGQPVVYQTWLASLIFWGVNSLGGALLTNLLRAVLLGIFYIFTWLALGQAGAGPRLASLITLVAALAASSNWAMRPQLFAYPLFGVSLWALLRQQKGNHKTLRLLPLLAALWVNLHGSFLLLFLLLAAALATGKGDRRRLAISTGFCFLASFLNPYGFQEWVQVISMMRNPSILQFSTEFFPPVNQGWQMNLFFAWLLILPLLAAITRKKPDRLQWLLFLGFGWMALSSLRYIIWFTVILAVMTGGMLADRFARFDRPPVVSHARLNLAAGSILLLMPSIFLPGVRDAWWRNAPPALSENTPVEAVRWLAGHPEIPGPLFSELAFSSYLTAALPDRPVWIHPRFESFPPEHFKRYLEISRASSGWQEQLDKDRINLLLLSRRDQPDLISAVGGSDLWRQVYRDDTAVIFSRSGN